MRFKIFLKKEVYYDFVCIKNIIKYILFPNKYLLLKTSIKYTKGHVEKFNWGDDVSFVLVGFLSQKKPLYYPNTRLSRLIPIRTYMTVGSIFTYFSLNKTVVWGSGIINQNEVNKLSGIPDNIFAVRGPLTRSLLIEKGIDCPAVYGDPALLFPMIYKPVVQKKWKVGIIPHYTDIDSKALESVKNDKEIKIIYVQGYREWKEFIEEICSCDCIASSSLHGLIISEAYGIPSVWIKLQDYVDGWDFKFKDFYASICKQNTEPLVIQDTINIDRIYKYTRLWKQGEINSIELIESCPFYTRLGEDK